MPERGLDHPLGPRRRSGDGVAILNEAAWVEAWRAAGLASRPTMLESVGSTQDALRAAAEGGADHGACVVAETQTGGRGRLGRRWCSTRGGLYLSCLLRADRPAREGPRWTIAAGGAAHEAFAACGFPEARIKWPNDLWTGRGKIAGALVEGRSRGDRWSEVLVGWGVNLLERPQPRVAPYPTDAWVSAKGTPNGALRARLAASFVRALLERHEALQRGDWPHVRDDWCSRPSRLDGLVRTDRGVGTVDGLDDRGRLAIRLETGILTVLDDVDRVVPE